ncbi:6-carboxyhexanoate--CoA ligase [Corynebacterium kroppenstedtii]|uniref:Biotin biosynthesis bifunctional protein BioWF n=1 Tax=Corynebacterium kroppenstedtii (strain DSM 44385 / JCM 11950 / CIP 105744 / CCUG 35717) TaxID=645127 RepID=BIOWF_CORK4|nr:6-carboxyhexanoate--CoA ligase [Corynebacterium kroppenstedtii]C4LK80.1 RecName: Full=Biotin biosynthesis bifunctional protein BioWF; Includes: RecName: Full=6-carboxyhexanoate--CoA ligase; AltName: Full=Pimeloyl-CoA synthase; Includes: RecName: Full=8-amino-7-oxononanoate synthase; Short=AONS; AltName: Full=7-keto-8-amino-pelargonic acid synthase; Short=7-KAP synthase; AltName: Full=8-amino-7-ketopelargonate synthase [Corynebacterium kroppenstedtii DSM 44385]ACR18235.1 pimeloyl-CoA synthetase
MRFSIKMRASARVSSSPSTSDGSSGDHTESRDRADRHISGAERIVSASDIMQTVTELEHRAWTHSNGQPDDVVVSVHRVDEDEITHIPALTRETRHTHTVDDAHRTITEILRDAGIRTAEHALKALTRIRGMRGAMLLDADTGERRDTKDIRGVRVTALDNDMATGADAAEEMSSSAATKPYYCEALTLASKVQYHPAVCAELCISDDPDYTTGYVSTSGRYVRIENIKPMGSPQGGRVFLVRGTDDEIADCINYLENTAVIVHGIPWPPQDNHSAHRDEPDAFGAIPATDIATDLTTFAEQSLTAWENKGLRRYPLEFSSAPMPRTTVAGSDTLLFSSSNYLGLSEHPDVIAAATEALKHYGAGTGGSRLTTGNFTIHTSTERTLAEFTGYDDAVLFGTGYQANGAALATLATNIPEAPSTAPANTPGMTIFSDELNHASLIDGIRMATRGNAAVRIYPHKDTEHLENALAQCASPRKLIVSDGVFSMNGDIAPLPSIMRLARAHGSWVLIDDAHGTGTLGRTGRGIVEYWSDARRQDAGADSSPGEELPNDSDLQPDLLVVTASKALGSEGAAVCCSTPVAEFLRNRARGYVFSTSSAPASVAATQVAVATILREPERVHRLQDNSLYLRNQLREHGIPLVDGTSNSTPIIPIFIGDEADAVRISQGLSDRGFHVPGIRYPTVARGQAILRVTTMATHTRDDLDHLVDALRDLMPHSA